MTIGGVELDPPSETEEAELIGACEQCCNTAAPLVSSRWHLGKLASGRTFTQTGRAQSQRR
jgi:hypothetical protein